MTIRLSSGLRDSIVSNYGLGAMMYKGHIQVYSGAQPASADMPPTGTLLAFVTQDGLPIPVPGDDVGGLMLQLGANAGELVNDGSWVMKGVASGTPGWWRFVAAPIDAGMLSVTACRIDGAVGDSIAPALGPVTPATSETLAGFLLTLPYQ